MSSQARHLGWGVDHCKHITCSRMNIQDSSDARDSNAVDLTYFTVVQVHKLRYDSVNIFYDGSQHIKALFTKSAFDEANLVSCQVKIQV